MADNPDKLTLKQVASSNTYNKLHDAATKALKILRRTSLKKSKNAREARKLLEEALDE